MTMIKVQSKNLNRTWLKWSLLRTAQVFLFVACGVQVLMLSGTLYLSSLSHSLYPTSPPTSPPSSMTVVPEYCNALSRKGQFHDIYEKGSWSGVKIKDPADFYGDARWPPKETRRGSGSGAGSELGSNTETSLNILKDVIMRNGVRSVLDAPCGDANWILDSYVTDALLSLYVGLDVVGPVIENNNRRYAHHDNKKFLVWDAIECGMPKFFNATTGTEQPFDLVHVRDVIQHVTLHRGVKYFCGIFASGAKLLVTTTYPGTSENTNIEEGSWYPNNLALEPFSFPTDLENNCSQTHPEQEPDYTCVYDLTLPWVVDFVAKKC